MTDNMGKTTNVLKNAQKPTPENAEELIVPVKNREGKDIMHPKLQSDVMNNRSSSFYEIMEKFILPIIEDIPKDSDKVDYLFDEKKGILITKFSGRQERAGW